MIKDSITRLNRLGIAIRSSSRLTVTARARRFASQRTDFAQLNNYEKLAYFTVDYLYPNAPTSLRRQLADSMTDRYAKLKYECYRLGHYKNVSKASTTQIPKDRTLNDKNGIDKSMPSRTMKQNDNMEQAKASNWNPVSSIDTAQVADILLKEDKSKATLSNSARTMTEHVTRPTEPPVPHFEDGKDKTDCQFCFQEIDRSLVTQKQGEDIIKWSRTGR